MHSPGSTGPGDARAVSDGAERPGEARRGEAAGRGGGAREGWRLRAAVEARAVLRSWQGLRGSTGSGWGRGGVMSAADRPAGPSLQLCLWSAAGPARRGYFQP